MASWMPRDRRRTVKRGYGVAELSRELLFGAILAYVVAMMCYAAEYAFGVSAPGGSLLPSRARERDWSAPVCGAGSAVRSWAPMPAVGRGPPGRRRRRRRRPDRLAGDRGVGGCRSSAASRSASPPSAFFCTPPDWSPAASRPAGCRGATCTSSSSRSRSSARSAWLVLVLRRPAVRPLGLFVTLVLVLLLGFAGMVLYTAVAPLVPALNSYWLKIHVTPRSTASGLLLVGFVPAALFLIRAGYERSGKRRSASRTRWGRGCRRRRAWSG